MIEPAHSGRPQAVRAGGDPPQNETNMASSEDVTASPLRQFRLTSCPDPLWVRGHLCANPDCECAETFIELLEHDETQPFGWGRVKLSLEVDVETWQETKKPARPAALETLAQDFLREYPASERHRWRAALTQKRRLTRRLQEYRIDPKLVEAGTLVPFGDIASEHRSLWSGGNAYAFSIQPDDVEYLLVDLYCPNPDCECRDFHLAFFRCTPKSPGGEPKSVRMCFLATLSLDGDVKTIQREEGTQADASRVLETWRDGPTFVTDMEDFRWRAWKIKSIALRNDPPRARWPAAETPESPPADRLSSPPRVGRNDPCPCGSGKKFKKCCAKSAG